MLAKRAEAGSAIFPPWGLTLAGGSDHFVASSLVESTRDGRVFKARPSMPVAFYGGCLVSSGKDLYALASAAARNARTVYHLSASANKWSELASPMKVDRGYAACGLVKHPKSGTSYIVVSGGRKTVSKKVVVTHSDMDLLNLKTLQWSTGA